LFFGAFKFFEPHYREKQPVFTALKTLLASCTSQEHHYGQWADGQITVFSRQAFAGCQSTFPAACKTGIFFLL
jgi:hypothetical protein